MTIRDTCAFALCVYIVIGQMSMLCFYARSEGRPVPDWHSFSDFAEDVGGYFLAMLLHFIAWPYYAGISETTHG